MKAPVSVFLKLRSRRLASKVSMTQRLSRILAGALVLAVAILPSDALGQRRAPDGEPRPGTGRFDRAGGFPNRAELLARAIRSLDLTPEQQRSLRLVRARTDGPVREAGRKILDGRRAVEEALAAGDLERARAGAAELGRLVGERTRARTLLEAELFRLLTPEQRAELRSRRAEQQERAATRREGRREARRDLRRGGGRGAGEGRFAERLGLTPEQRERFRELRRRRGAVALEAAATYRETQRAVDDALLADTIDTALVERLAAELDRAEAARELGRFELELEIRSILTPEQAAMIRERRHKRARGVE